MKAEYRKIETHLIDVPEGRLREASADRIEVLSKDIQANGLLHAIGVAEEANGRFTLIYGATRLAAVNLLKAGEIDARVQPANWLQPSNRRMQEIMENLDRQELTKLERAESLAELKVVYEQLFPDTANGKSRKKDKAHGQNEIFSFRLEAAARTGLDKRSIELAVQMVTNLTAESKDRVRLTWLADHQAGLKALSEQDEAMQAKVCDLLFANPPEAANVAEAIMLAEGRKPPSPADRLFASVQNSFGRLSDKQRASFFELHEQHVRAFAEEKGWL